MTIDTHVCLVSGQPSPNLSPLFDHSMRPRRVTLVVSHDMKEKADWLEAILKKHGVGTKRWPIEDAWDIEYLQTRMLELIEDEFNRPERRELALNITGGTKPMSIAAHEAFRLYDLPIFYVHPERDRIIWIHPGDRAPLDLDDRIKLEDFLAAHGVAVTNNPGRNIPDTGLLQVGKEIVMNIAHYQKPLGTLNYLASKAEKNLQSPQLKGDKGALRQLIDLFESAGFVQRHKNTLKFRDENSRFFANGGWLEYFVFDAVRQLRHHDKTIHDIARSIEIGSRHNGKIIPNELDVAFLRNNRLHIVECKTARFKGQGEDAPGAEILYKLDAIGDKAGGIQARSMLVSFQEIKTHDRRRAADLGIQVCSGKALQNLQAQLEHFIS